MIKGYRAPGTWWFRILGYGLHCKDRRRFPYDLYSDRQRRRLKIGRWVIKVLVP